MNAEPAPRELPAEEGSAALARLEIPIAAGISALFFTAFLSMRLVGGFFYPLAGVSLVRLTHRRGAASGLLAATLAGVIVFAVGLVSGSAGAAVALGAQAFAASALPVAAAARVRRGTDPSRAYLGLCIVGALLSTGLLLALPLLGEPPLTASLRVFLDANIPAAMESWKRSGMDAATLEQMRRAADQAREIVVRYWPGLLGLAWALSSAVTFYLGAWAGRPAPSAEATRFESLRIPAGGAMLFVASGAAFALFPGPPRTVSGAVLVLLAALYFLAGLSIICHFARRWFRARILRVGIYVLAAYFPMSLGVALLGLFDWYVNFRRRGEKGEREKK
jgi:hypothetical protein